MSPQKPLFALLSFLLPFSAITRGQEPQAQPSLGDLARQVRKDKEKNGSPPKVVITDDTLSLGKGQKPPEGQGNATVYFVAVGDAQSSQISDLVAHYKAKFNIQIVVLAPMAVSKNDIDLNRRQLIAEEVIESLRRSYADRLKSNSAVLIGITSHDMYPRGEDWQFCFGWRDPDARIAVVSTARMNLHYPGEPANQADSTIRVRKMVTKDIGIMCFGMSPNHNPRSVLFDGILGIEELDQVTEDF